VNWPDTKLQKRPRQGARVLFAASVSLASLGAYAQSPPPHGIGPVNQVPQGSPLPGIERPSEPAVGPGIKTEPAIAPAANAPAVSVAISDVSVEGSTAYSPAVLQRITAGLTGPAVSEKQIDDARIALLNRYRGDGYIYTSVSARVRDGHLRLVVTEARIVDVKLEGNIGPAGTQVLRFLHQLTRMQPIDVKKLERYLLLAGDVPGVTISSVLNPSAEDPGALTLVAQVHREPVTGQLSADNRAFRQTGPEELLALADFNSFTSFGERTEVSLFHTFNNTETFGQALEEFFIGGSGLKLKIYGGAGETVPSGSLRLLGYDGITRVGGVQVTYPIIRTRQQTLTVAGIFDAVESEIDLSGNHGKSVRASFDSLRVLRGEVDYTALDTLFGTAHSATSLVTYRLSQGLPILGASPNGDRDAPRVGERTDFTKMSGEVDRTQLLFTLAQGRTISLKLAAAGQYSGNILPPAEKFYLGGPHFGRGFYYGEVTGDSGAETTVEPLFDTRLPKPSFEPLPLSAEFYGFYDWGESFSNLREDQTHNLRSLGGGVRLYAGERVEIDVEGVSRLTRTPDGTGVSRLKSSAVYWQILAHI
jgi:hemolysin activation/secretion protein